MPAVALTDTPPRAPPIKYAAHFGTRWQKEKAAAGQNAFDFPDDPRRIGPWIIGECVGKGASGRVRIAKHRRTGQLAAIKMLPLQPLLNSRASLATLQAKSEKQRLSIDREIIMMKLMNHPNILRIYDVYEGEKELYLVLEYVEGGELFDFLVNRGRLPPLEALAYFKQIIYGLNYAHTFSIIHRDLKPENILIHSLHPPLIKIADWGMAAFAPPALQLETSCGSPHYASPEIVNGLKYEGNATDIWSCGVILYALLAGRLPFDDKNVRTLLAKVKTGKYETPAYIDPQAKDLLSRMLIVDVARRITIPEIMAHPWFNKTTPGILYVPAPSVFELARPLESFAHIDRDLLESLRIIWGRHADAESIKLDLLSPSGEGTLSKAFYFLLQQCREQTMKDNGIIMDVEDTAYVSGEKIVTKQYTAPPAQLNTLDAQNAMRNSRQGHREMQDPSSTLASPVSPTPMVPSSPVQSQRSRPPSPIGPRPPKSRPTSSPIAQGGGSRYIQVESGSSAKREMVSNSEAQRSRSSTVSAASPRVNRGPQTQHHSGRSSHQRMFQPMHIPGFASPTPPVRFPLSPPRHSAHPILSPGIVQAPVPVNVPGSPNTDAQMIVDDAAERAIILIARGNGVQSSLGQAVMEKCTEQECLSSSERYGRYQAFGAMSTCEDEARHTNSQDDKENRAMSVDGHQMYRDTDLMQISGGLGFAKTHKVGREMRNSVHGGERLKNDNTKEKKSWAPSIDFHPPGISGRRSTVSSPLQVSSPAMSHLLISPVVGEFKGWFSNLFNWKAHTYVLCSMNNLSATRNETTRLLGQFGVSVALEESDGCGILRCRRNDIVDSLTGSVVQKHVRFRVELCTNPGSALSPQPGGGNSSRFSQQGAFSPGLGSSRFAMPKTLMNGCQCAIVLVQEKGSMSTFRVICRWLREEWTLDALQSPIMGQGGATPLVEFAHRFAA